MPGPEALAASLQQAPASMGQAADVCSLPDMGRACRAAAPADACGENGCVALEEARTQPGMECLVAAHKFPQTDLCGLSKDRPALEPHGHSSCLLFMAVCVRDKMPLEEDSRHHRSCALKAAAGISRGYLAS